MKKLLYILFLCFVSIFVNAQSTPYPGKTGYPISQSIGSDSAVVRGKGPLAGRMILYRYVDTTAANLERIKNYPFALIGTTSDGLQWYRSADASRWINISSSGGGGDTFTQINDTTLVICSPTACDTIHLGNSNTFNIFVDTTTNQFYIVTCDTVQNICVGDSCYQQQVCDTILIPALVSTFYQNLLWKNGTIVEAGDPLFGINAQMLHDTYFNTQAYQLKIQGAPADRPPLAVKQGQWVQLSSTIADFNSYGKYPPTDLLDGDNPVGLQINYTDPFRGDTLGFMGNRYAYMIMTNSIGANTHYIIQDVNAKQVGMAFHTYDLDNTDGITFFAQRVPSSYSFANIPAPDTTLLDQRIMVLKTDHDIQFNNYPSTRNDGAAPMAFYPDANGNVKVGPVQGGGSITFDNDTVFICSFGNNLCDTFIVTLTAPIQYVTIINDTMLRVCDTNLVCDTLIINSTTPGIDQRFFTPNQISLANTLHETSGFNFSVGNNLITSAGATNSYNYGKDSRILTGDLNTVFLNNNRVSGNENFVPGRNMIVAGNTNFVAATDGTVFATANYSATFGDAPQNRGIAALTANFGNINWAENGVTLGSNNLNGSLNPTVGTANLYSNSTVLGLQNISLGSRNLVAGAFLTANNTSGDIILFGKGISIGSRLTATETSSFNVGFASNIPNFTIHAAGSTYIESVIAEPASTGIVQTIAEYKRLTTGTAGDGIGVEVDFNVETDGGTSQTSNYFSSRWTTAANATRTSQLILGGTNSGVLQDLVYLQGTGQIRALNYGTGLFTTGTATYLIATTSSGNYIEFPTGGLPGGGNLITADNGITANTATNVQLGSTSTSGSPLLHDTYINTTASYTLFIRGSNSSNLASSLYSYNVGGGTAIYASNYLVGSDPTLPTVRADVTPNTNTTAFTVLEIGNSGNVSGGANGIGTNMVFKNATTTLLLNNAGSISNIITSKWVDATTATRTSQLDITGVNSTSTTTIMSAYGSGVVGIGISSSYTATRLNVVDNALGAATMVSLTSNATTAASNVQQGLAVTLTGTNATSGQSTYGAHITNTHDGTTSNNYGLLVDVSGGASSNNGIVVNATGAPAYGVSANATSWGVYATGGIAGVQGNSSSVAVWGVASGSGVGVQSNTVNAASFVGVRESATTNTVIPLQTLSRETSGTAADGIGGSIDLYLESDNGTGGIANQLIWKYTTAANATRTSQLDITGVTGASTQTWLTIGQSGYVKFRPMTVTEAGAIATAEGLMVFVSNTDATFTSIGLWIYQNGAWKAL